jgi:hypothetical protein
MTKEKMPMSLAQIGEKIKQMFQDNKTDEDIAKELGLYGGQVSALRSVLKLHRAWRINAFEKWKKMPYNDYTELFSVQFSIPHKVREQLKMKINKKYNYFATAEEPNKIVLEIEEKGDE